MEAFASLLLQEGVIDLFALFLVISLLLYSVDGVQPQCSWLFLLK